MFGGFAAKQRTAGLRARHGYALNNRGNAFRKDLAARDVVGHEQRFGAAHDKIVDDHADQIETNGVVAIEGLCDGDLGAYPIGRCRQHRMIALSEPTGVEETREATDAANDLRTPSLGNPFLHQLDSAVTNLDVDPSLRVR
jgi:hypothetical protein